MIQLERYTNGLYYTMKLLEFVKSIDVKTSIHPKIFYVHFSNQLTGFGSLLHALFNDLKKIHCRKKTYRPTADHNSIRGLR